MTTLQIVLASNSPRRREMLGWMGIPFTSTSADIDESPLQDETPVEYVERLAERKASVSGKYAPFGGLILAADTTVADGNEIIGKPLDVDDARRILKQLHHRNHMVHTALVVSMPSKGSKEFELCSTRVKMRAYSNEEVEEYLQSGDAMDKAGAYAIQHEQFNPVEKMTGCYASVMGLPLCHFERILRRLGYGSRKEIPYRCQDELSYTCPIYKRVLSGENIG